MPAGNVSFVKDFVIVGFPGLQPHYYGLVSAVLFLVYLSLQKPVYYCIINLVVCDVLFSTTKLPKIIGRYWFQDGTISFLGCFLLMFFVHYFGSVTVCLLAVMAIDRHAAICFPLRYHSIMTNRNVFILILGSWLLGLIGPLMMIIRAYPLPYCASNVIVHCCCDHIYITTLACTDREEYSYLELLLGSLAVIVFSYCVIIVSVPRKSSAQERTKTFSTCSTQTDWRLVIIMMYNEVKKCYLKTSKIVCLYIILIQKNVTLSLLSLN
uniref:G-protein coupled receptors family 1 profile domain-containing protein n=1 Tax=Sinocyclocheilus grahami TaxID=75366 RepID=A0A672MIA9_SINGR